MRNGKGHAALDSQGLVEQIRPLLAGQRPEIVGLALADLTAMLIAGHKECIRIAMLKLQFELIVNLIPVNERIILERMTNAGLQEERAGHE